MSEILGKGAFGIVYQDPDDPHKAIKMSKYNSPDFALLREMYTLALPPHPDLVRMDRVMNLRERRSNIVMPKALSDLQKKMRSIASDLSLEQVAGIFYQIFCGLEALHTLGLAHLDLKPSNVLVFSWEPHGAIPEVKLGDFGLVEWMKSPVQKDPNETVTFLFRPPEHLCSQDAKTFRLSTASDIYSAGILMLIVLEMWATGRWPDLNFIPSENQRLTPENTAQKIASILGATEKDWAKYCGKLPYPGLKEAKESLIHSPNSSLEDTKARRSMPLFQALNAVAKEALAFDRDKRPSAIEMMEKIWLALVGFGYEEELPECPSMQPLDELSIIYGEKKLESKADEREQDEELLDLLSLRGQINKNVKDIRPAPDVYYKMLDRIPDAVDNMGVDDRLRAAAIMALSAWIPRHPDLNYKQIKLLAAKKNLLPPLSELEEFYRWLLKRNKDKPAV